ncbi:hypothetical protein Hanom_Chr01g00015421 [Helianthus anomalus]
MIFKHQIIVNRNDPIERSSHSYHQATLVKPRVQQASCKPKLRLIYPLTHIKVELNQPLLDC